MKGQIFIMISVLVLIALLLLRNSLKPIEIKPQNFLYENFINLKGELIKTVDISILNKENVSTNLKNFIIFSNNIFESKNYNEDVKFDVSTYGNTTIVNVNVTLGLDNSFIEDKFIINRTVYS